ncbi:hypothetical protein LP420_31025 [Massilia sp. B-10]|nr:hypothetical protein LP420_31025 [Massilia sp. B-10]
MESLQAMVLSEASRQVTLTLLVLKPVTLQALVAAALTSVRAAPTPLEARVDGAETASVRAALQVALDSAS